ncbi:MAG: ABC transporter substrate-binding protein, partial [Chloroflexi bacterium]|nr:ABC transporter substrate-binding protein [Chloroflexota bacterium]
DQESLVYTLEDLLKWNPDVMIVSSAAEKEKVLADTRLADVKAVKNDQIFIIPRIAHVWGNRTTEQPLTIFWTMNKLYPEIMTDEALSKEIFYFYSHFFKVDLTDEQIQEIINYNL